jgi:hypothetical protein
MRVAGLTENRATLEATRRRLTTEVEAAKERYQQAHQQLGESSVLLSRARNEYEYPTKLGVTQEELRNRIRRAEVHRSGCRQEFDRRGRELNRYERHLSHVNAAIDDANREIHGVALVPAKTAPIVRLRSAVQITAEKSRAVAAQRRASGVLNWFSAFVPVRIGNEEIGDALERIDLRVQGGCSPVWVYINMIMTIVWVTLHVCSDLFKGKHKE